jgi:hypothetical protein
MKEKSERKTKHISVALPLDTVAYLDKVAKKRKVSRHLLLVNFIVRAVTESRLSTKE